MKTTPTDALRSFDDTQSHAPILQHLALQVWSCWWNHRGPLHSRRLIDFAADIQEPDLLLVESILQGARIPELNTDRLMRWADKLNETLRSEQGPTRLWLVRRPSGRWAALLKRSEDPTAEYTFDK